MEDCIENKSTYLSSWASQRLLLPHFPLYISPLFFLRSVCLFISAYSGFTSLSLSFLVVIFTKRLVKGPAYPQVWIRFTQGLWLYLVLFALRGVRRLRAREGFLTKFPSLVVRVWWRGWGIPYRTYPSFFCLCINLLPPLESKQYTKWQLKKNSSGQAVKYWVCGELYWHMTLLLCLFSSAPLSCHSFAPYLVDLLHLFNCSYPFPSPLDCSSSTSSSSTTTPSLQPSDADKGPGWSCGPSASSVPSPVAWRGGMPDGAQIQERPGAEAEDPAAGTFSATTPGRPLPHRGLPWGDIWGIKKKKHLKTTPEQRMTLSHTDTHKHRNAKTTFLCL